MDLSEYRGGVKPIENPAELADVTRWLLEVAVNYTAAVVGMQEGQGEAMAVMAETFNSSRATIQALAAQLSAGMDAQPV